MHVVGIPGQVADAGAWDVRPRLCRNPCAPKRRLELRGIFNEPQRGDMDEEFAVSDL